MNKKELQEKLFALWVLEPEEQAQHWAVYGESLSVLTWQEKPNTAVRVAYQTVRQEWIGYGFTKVRYPDVWNAYYGINLAVKKALASIARQIVEEVNGKQ